MFTPRQISDAMRACGFSAEDSVKVLKKLLSSVETVENLRRRGHSARLDA